MGKTTIIEAQNSETIYEQDGHVKGTLGKLKGVFADFKNGTRNNERLYTEELWDNRVFGSPDVMEALETRTLFGELDHPEGDRCETLAKNAAITITKLEKRPDEGIIYGEAEILDTPTGRILKSLADSGAKLGVSSRGLGEEICVEGRNVVDPETYDFITFDVVVTPANTKARVSLTESKKQNKLVESIIKEINESETKNQLNQIKTVVENTSIQNKDTLLKQIENKTNTLNVSTNPGTNVRLTEANRALALEVLKKKLTQQSVIIEQKEEDNKQITEQKEFLSTSRDMIKTKLKEANEKINKLNNNIEEIKTESKKSIQESTIILQKQLKALTEKNKRLEENNKKLEETNKQLSKEKEELKESNKKLNIQIDNAKQINEQISNKILNYDKALKETKKTNTTLEKNITMLKEQQNKNKIINKRLTETKQRQQLREKELQKEVSELKEQLHRFSKLSFNPIGTASLRAENEVVEEQYTQDELDLFNALVQK